MASNQTMEGTPMADQETERELEHRQAMIVKYVNRLADADLTIIQQEARLDRATADIAERNQKIAELEAALTELQKPDLKEVEEVAKKATSKAA